ncbi:hypothetical protein [Blastococcus sp. CT_GayMR16]|uniref:hypothetical protein n=1 Tax=Blastococcus sp. CT_GayMR16 TaxID=2559607 RepID=UPI001073B238|nr:hypothetical protein [Blastococcus sp. CT_GayMR16]TFV86120.1 hypothetical protein E4P38_17835 [Blastococcus sp. CT_GayMR16]
MEETELRNRLDALAERTAPPAREAADLTTSVVARHHAQRRRQWAVAAAVVAVLVLVPAVRALTAHEPTPAAPPSEQVDVFGGPTRGSLADDTALIDAIQRLPWIRAGDPPDDGPSMTDLHVVWADDVETERWALVAGIVAPAPPAVPADDAPLAVAWFVGPRGATADQLAMQHLIRDVDRHLPTALTGYRTGGGVFHSTTVVVAAPEDRIEVSLRPEIAASGTVTRQFEDVPPREGVAVVFDTHAAIGDPTLHYRVLRNGAYVTLRPDSEVDSVPPLDRDPTAEVPVERLRDAPSGHPGDSAAPTIIADLLAGTGLPPDQLVATVLWAGDLPSVISETARATVMAVRLPSGAIYVDGVLGLDGGAGPFAVHCGSELRAATPVERLVVVLHCSSVPPSDPPDAGERLIVLGPPEATTARLLDAQGQVLGSNPMVDGVAVVPMPDNLATVEVLGAGGDTLDARAPMGVADLTGD